MENTKTTTTIETLLNDLINSTEDKKALETLGSLKSEFQALDKEQETVRHQMSLLEEDNKFYKEAYRESIKYGGFKTEHTAKQEQPEIGKSVDFDSMLKDFMSKDN